MPENGKNLFIDGVKIGTDCPVYIVAEISANHMQSLDKAKDLLWAAQKAGANAVKLQTFTADTITLNSRNDDFQISEDSPWHSYGSLYNLFKHASMPWDHQKEMFAEARAAGITLFSSPFDGSAVDFLEELDCPAYKIASPEITDVNLIRRCAMTGKPVILSTGVADIADIELALQVIRECGSGQVIVLKCTASYPAPIDLLNLRTISDLAERFDCLAGLSDHSIDSIVPPLSVALGACLIEKHLVLDKSDDTLDAFFSLDPDQFASMVGEVRLAESALGRVQYELDENTKKDLRGRRSLYIAQDINAGEVFTNSHVRSVRPAFGLAPKYLNDLIGKAAKTDLKFGDRVRYEDIDWD